MGEEDGLVFEDDAFLLFVADDAVLLAVPDVFEVVHCLPQLDCVRVVLDERERQLEEVGPEGDCFLRELLIDDELERGGEAGQPHRLHSDVVLVEVAVADDSDYGLEFGFDAVREVVDADEFPLPADFVQEEQELFPDFELLFDLRVLAEEFEHVHLQHADLALRNARLLLDELPQWVVLLNHVEVEVVVLHQNRQLHHQRE